MSGYDKVLEKWALARGIGYPRSCQECPERKEGCYKNCRFLKAYEKEKDELPDGFDFAVLEVPETERDRLVRKAKAEVAREILDELEEVLCGEFLTERFWFDLGKLRIKYIEGQK